MIDKYWKRARLADLLTQVSRPTQIDPASEYTLLGAHWYAKGLYIKEVKQGAAIKASNLYRVDYGDFVYNRLFAWKGSFAVATEENDGCFVSNEFPCFKVDSGKIDANYLWHYFSRESSWNEALGLSYGATPTSRNRLKEKHFLSLEIPLPPLSEQRRIVAKIEQIAGKLEEARGLRTTLNDVTNSLFVSYRAEKIRECLSKGEIPITEAVLFERGKFSHRPRNDPQFFDGDHPWIQIGEIEASDKYITSWNTTLNDEGLAISRKFSKGTVLISIAATIGAVGILGFECCIPDSIVAATPKPGIDSEFVYHYLGFLRTHLEEVAPQSAQKNINLKILSGLPFPSISESEQLEIACCLDRLQAKLDDLKAQQVEIAAALDVMLPSILDRTFKGKL
ncbi:MAG TPA: restriction endonuclease subunit S [Desulfobacteraceae bacterium]|nr:restriction endonuclease subunit S [Desulfobacteraceae bacterium]HPJ67088.1 restriction endonuclease subunit S [Desulfobacteraceae bacterium]HPQ29214.1 restriction endonuclease subunit S [Desulfobacteraceae bacterium]